MQAMAVSSAKSAIKGKIMAMVLPVLLPLVLLISGFVILLGGAIAPSFDSGMDTLPSGTAQGLSPKTLRFKKPIQEELKAQGVSLAWTDLLLAHVEVETHGDAERYPDILQASESVKGANVTNALTTDQSIHYGVLAFKRQLEAVKDITGHNASPTSESDVNITSVLYNAPAFGPWLKSEHGGKWSVGANNTFYALILPKYGAGSGDKNYYQKILNYYDPSSGKARTGGSFTISGAKNAKDYFADVMNEAKKYQGRAYVWGGSNPSTGFDCSGLVQWAFAKAGITLPRTSQQQYSAVKHIGASDAKQGDLIFFSGTNPSQSGMTHVGIYLGNGQMFNAQDNGVRIDKVSDWTALYPAYYGSLK